MTQRSSVPVSVSVSLLAAVAAVPALEAGEPIEQPNRLTFGPRVGFNVRAGFSSALASPTAQPGPPTGGGVDRVYDDGYVRLDNSGNAEGKTWYWGYDQAAQVDLAGDNLRLNALTSVGRTPEREVTGDPYVGGELTYTRYLFEWGRANWGLELGGSFMPLEIKDSSSLSGLLTSVTDAFSLGGVVPPAAPYRGTFEGPGPVIGDTPTRTTLDRQVSYTGDRKIETMAVGLRLGPSLDVSMGKPLSLQISGGLHVLYADSDYTFNENVILAEGGTLRSQSGSVSQQDWVFGAYVRGQFLLALSRSLGIVASVEYLMTDRIEFETGGHRARLDFTESFGCTAGLAWTF
ncbi:MAG: hypothetical protein M5U12_35435 [Verrucomicrobia bacterium]|nr:hypothetical protein [Verrucomicrobiota bacterium]